MGGGGGGGGGVLAKTRSSSSGTRVVTRSVKRPFRWAMANEVGNCDGTPAQIEGKINSIRLLAGNTRCVLYEQKGDDKRSKLISIELPRTRAHEGDVRLL